MGVGVTVQAMVYGNISPESSTGVAFSYNVAHGKEEIYAEYLPFAQGEDVTYGVGAPQSIEFLKEKLPNVYMELVSGLRRLEEYYKKAVEKMLGKAPSAVLIYSFAISDTINI